MDIQLLAGRILSQLKRGCDNTPQQVVTINSIKFENYRSFVDGVDVQLRPLTLLFGYNSAGKSALLRGLPLIAASLRTQERAPMALVCPAARQASFSDLLPHPEIG